MKVLFGIGGDGHDFEALEVTTTRASAAGDDLVVAILEELTDEEADAVASAVRETLDESGVDADVRRLTGHPGSELTELAEREGFDRIVLSGGRRSPLGKIDLGDVSEFVLLNADVSVTLIR